MSGKHGATGHGGKRSRRWARWLGLGLGIGLAGSASAQPNGAMPGGAMPGGAMPGAMPGGATMPSGALPPDAGVLPAKTYLNKSTFFLPVSLEGQAKTDTREVRLYVKEGPSQPWGLRDRISPTEKRFVFKVPHDGEYWFTAVTVDHNGRADPPDVNKAAPGLIVVVDRELPELDVAALPASAEGLLFKVAVRDAHLCASKTQVCYQTQDNVWRPLAPVGGQGEEYCIPRQAALTGMIKVTASDLAGNTATHDYNLSVLAAATPRTVPPAVAARRTGPGAAIDRGSGAGSEAGSGADKGDLPVIGDPGNAPGMLDVPAKGNEPELVQVEMREPVLPALPKAAPPMMVEMPPALGSHRPSQQAACGAARTGERDGSRQLVNTCHVSLEYQIDQVGPSGVGRVEIWITADKGKSWQKLGEDADRRSPAEIDLPGDGVYGISLRVMNGRGSGDAPPQAGDAPDYSVEVDTTRPVVQITSLRTAGAEPNCVNIVWTARDRNLGANPIDLYYAPTQDGPWQPIVKGLRNDGQYRWMAPDSAGVQAYVRVAARDIAGNVGQCDSAQPVALQDVSHPRCHILGVSTMAPRTTGSTED